MKRQRQPSTQCPACNKRDGLDWKFIQLPGGDCSHLAVCDRCDYSPNLQGYLRQVPGGGCRVEPLKRRRGVA